MSSSLTGPTDAGGATRAAEAIEANEGPEANEANEANGDARAADDSSSAGGSPLPTAKDVIDFWFGAPGSPHWLQTRPEWFRKDPAFDAVIEARFGVLLTRALHGQVDFDADTSTDADADALTDGPSGPAGGAGSGATALPRLARILVCDQFSRNVWRGRPKSFALDPIALATTRTLVGTPEERALPAVQRQFVYMPLMHSESEVDQAQCVQLFEALAAEWSPAKNSLDYARRHEEVIRRFGRFPHRNEILGRDSTPEELAYLKEPGSGF